MIIKGDINGDGKINIEDELLYWEQTYGIIAFSQEERERADVNNNGSIDGEDQTRIFNHAHRTTLLEEVIYE